MNTIPNSPEAIAEKITEHIKPQYLRSAYIREIAAALREYCRAALEECLEIGSMGSCDYEGQSQMIEKIETLLSQEPRE